MRSSFFEFNVATSALFTAKAALEVTSHNVANAETKGYSKQYVKQRASTPITYFNGRGMIGTGAEVYGIGQIRNTYIDQKYWSERPVLGEYSIKSTQLSLMESIFNELSATGLNHAFSDFFDKLHDLTTTAGNVTYRTNVLQAAESLSKFINNTTENLKKQQTDLNGEVKTVVDIINSIGIQISSLNEQIGKYELDGSSANDLRDERARLVDELSSYVNVDVSEKEMNPTGISDKRFVVLINGYDFINGYDVNTMRCVAREGSTNPMDVPGLYDIKFNNGNGNFDLYHPNLKGELKGLIDIRDGNNGSYLTGSIYSVDAVNNTITLKDNLGGPFRSDMFIDGKIKLKTSSGSEIELAFKDFVVNADDTVTVELKNPLPANIASYTSATIGKTTTYKGIPHYLNKMNELVRVFARAMNEGVDKNGNQISGFTGHQGGFDSEGNPGGLFFSFDGITAADLDVDGNLINYNKITCQNFSVSKILKEHPEFFAASDNANREESNNKTIFGMLSLKDYNSLFNEGKVGDFLIGMSGELGIDKKQADNFYKNYTDVTAMIDNQRKSVSGVDVNEEMIDLVKYQQLYQAAAKLMNTIDSIYDTLINKIGV